jgi:diadenylate cyclase
MSEQSDAVILVVSEETGAISLAYDTKLYYDLSPLEVTRKLKELLDKGARRETSQKDMVLDSPPQYSAPLKEGDVFVEQ